MAAERLEGIGKPGMDPKQFEQLIVALDNVAQSMRTSTWRDVMLVALGGLIGVFAAIVQAEVSAWRRRQEKAADRRHKMIQQNRITDEMRKQYARREFHCSFLPGILLFVMGLVTAFAIAIILCSR